MSENLINIQITIADRLYPMKIKPEEEEVVRKATRLINEKVKELQNQYDAKDKRDFLAMVALMYAVEALSSKSENGPDFMQKLDALESAISARLSDGF